MSPLAPKRLALALALACGSAALGATELRIPALAGGKASIRLVYQAEQTRQVLGFEGPEWATAYQSLDLTPAEEDITVELTPTASIATTDGRATCYLIGAQAPGGRGWSHCVQVPDSGTVQELSALVGATAIDPADILAGYLLPSTSGASAGWGLILDSALDPIWSAAAGGGCTTLSCLVDGPSALGTAGQILATNATATAWEWIAAPTGGGSGTVTSVAVSGSDGIQVDSGSPIATAGTIALGIDGTTLATHLGLGGAAYLGVGTTAGTVAAGDDSRFTAITAVGSGVNFFPTDTAIIAAGTNNTYPVKTLSTAPSGATEDVDSIVIAAGTTVMYGTYLSPVLLNDQLDGGIWEFHVYAGVDSTTGVTTLTQNVYRVRPAVGTVTVTGTGTSRTATASGGTPFATANIDASAAIADSSFVQTPLGLYPVTARTSDTVVTITTPTGYANESAVAFSVHKKLFGVTSGEINAVAGTGPAYAGIVLLPEMQSVQGDIPLVSGDRLASSFLGTSSSSRTLFFAHDGTSRYSHFHTPLTFVVDLASGVSGVLPAANGGTGQTALSALDAAALGSGSATDNAVLTADGAAGAAWEALPRAATWYTWYLGNMTDAVTTGTKVRWIAPASLKISAAHGSCDTAATASSLVANVNDEGTSIFVSSEEIEIEAGEKDSLDATTQPNLTNDPHSVQAGDEITFAIDTAPGGACLAPKASLLITWD